MKRSDLDTRTLLRAVDEHGLDVWTVLVERFPRKIVIAAIEREVSAKRLNYGVSVGYPWLEPDGRRWLADHDGETPPPKADHHVVTR